MDDAIVSAFFRKSVDFLMGRSTEYDQVTRIIDESKKNGTFTAKIRELACQVKESMTTKRLNFMKVRLNLSEARDLETWNSNSRILNCMTLVTRSFRAPKRLWMKSFRRRTGKHQMLQTLCCWVVLLSSAQYATQLC